MFVFCGSVKCSAKMKLVIFEASVVPIGEPPSKTKEAPADDVRRTNKLITNTMTLITRITCLLLVEVSGCAKSKYM
jgi:hypothetical protein